MNTFFKAVVIIIVAVLLSVSLPKSAKDFHIVLIVGVCVCLAIVICYFLDPILDTIRSLAELGGIDSPLMAVLIKTCGVAVLTEFVVYICNDSGNSAMGKGIQLLGSVVILWLSLPLITTLFDIIRNVMISS